MNYLKHYVSLIRKAERRGWTKETAPCYVEEHHTFPKAIYGGNGRVVFLTAREHYVAHALLVRVFKVRCGVGDWKTVKMAFALSMMSSSKRKHPPNSRVYEVCREVISNSQKEKLAGTFWWTDGETEIQSKECPGDGWSRGRKPGQGWKSGSENPSTSQEFKEKRSLMNKDPEFIKRMKETKRKNPKASTSTLTDEEVKSIYKDPRPVKEISKEYGRSESVIGKIKRGKTFCWITQEP